MARVVLVADTLDAMSFSRSYRQGLPIEQVYAELKKYSGSQFDAHIVKIFLETHPRWDEQSDVDKELFNQIKKRAA